MLDWKVSSRHTAVLTLCNTYDGEKRREEREIERERERCLLYTSDSEDE